METEVRKKLADYIKSQREGLTEMEAVLKRDQEQDTSKEFSQQRAPDPGEGYYLLNKTDIIKKGDEWTRFRRIFNEWLPWRKTVTRIGQIVAADHDRDVSIKYYRRKIANQKTPDQTKEGTLQPDLENQEKKQHIEKSSNIFPSEDSSIKHTPSGQGISRDKNKSSSQPNKHVAPDGYSFLVPGDIVEIGDMGWTDEFYKSGWVDKYGRSGWGVILEDDELFGHVVKLNEFFIRPVVKTKSTGAYVDFVPTGGDFVKEGDQWKDIYGDWHPLFPVGSRYWGSGINTNIKCRRLVENVEVKDVDESEELAAWEEEFNKRHEPNKSSRTIDPGNGYRLVAVGEIIEAGDEMYEKDNDNGTPGSGWFLVKHSVGKELMAGVAPARRKIVMGVDFANSNSEDKDEPQPETESEFSIWKNRHRNRLAAMQKLEKTIAAMNDGWWPNWKDGTQGKYYFLKDESAINIRVTVSPQHGNSAMYFKSKDIGKEIIAKLGNELIGKVLQ